MSLQHGRCTGCPGNPGQTIEVQTPITVITTMAHQGDTRTEVSDQIRFLWGIHCNPRIPHLHSHGEGIIDPTFICKIPRPLILTMRNVDILHFPMEGAWELVPTLKRWDWTTTLILGMGEVWSQMLPPPGNR